MSGVPGTAVGWTSQSSAASTYVQQQQPRTIDGNAISVAAAALRVPAEQLRDQLNSGASPADIAQSQGMNLTVLQGLISSAVEPQLDQAVQAGLVSRREAQALLYHLSPPAPPPVNAPPSADTARLPDDLPPVVMYGSDGAPAQPAGLIPQGQQLDAVA